MLCCSPQLDRHGLLSTIGVELRRKELSSKTLSRSSWLRSPLETGRYPRRWSMPATLSSSAVSMLSASPETRLRLEEGTKHR